MHNRIENIFDNSKIECFGQVKTDIDRDSRQYKKEKIQRKILKFFINLIYNIDSKTFKLLYGLSELKIYKKIGRIQRAYETNFEVYRIADDEFVKNTYYNPETSIFVIYKKY